MQARNAFLKVASEGSCSRTHGDEKDPNLQHSKQVLQPKSSRDKEPVKKDASGLTTEREKPHREEADEGVADVSESDAVVYSAKTSELFVVDRLPAYPSLFLIIRPSELPKPRRLEGEFLICRERFFWCWPLPSYYVHHFLKAFGLAIETS